MTFRDLPALNATLNGISACFLILGFIFIKRRNITAHKRCMLMAVTTSTLFLISYLTYHAKVGHTVFKNPEWFRPYYLALLATHLVLAIAIVPLVLLSLRWAFTDQVERHKRLARWTWPIWVYVSITGVVIYFLLYHLFPQSASFPP